jgi:hypothetical protein
MHTGHLVTTRRVLAAEQADTMAVAARFASKPSIINKRSKVAERVASGIRISPAGSTNLDAALNGWEPTSYCIKGLQVGEGRGGQHLRFLISLVAAPV